MKRVLCFLLACCFILLAACGTNGDSSQEPVTQGRYVETDITPPEGASMSFLAPDGAIVSYDTGLKNKYESADNGATWTQSPGPGAENGHLASVYTAAMLPDGTLVVFIENEGFFKILPDGSEEPFAVPQIDTQIAEGKAPYITHLFALSASRLFVHYFTDSNAVATDVPADEDAPDTSSDASATEPQSEPEETSPEDEDAGGSSWSSDYEEKTLLLDPDTGDTVAEVVNDGFTTAAADEECFYLLGYDGGISVYSLQTGSPAADSKKNVSLSASEEVMGYMNASMYASAQNGLYILAGGQLVQVDNDGNVETLLDGSAYAIGSPRAVPSSLFALPDGSVAVGITNTDGTSKLYKYTWDANATIDPANTLKIWSLKDNALVRATISEFRRQHPDTDIQYEVGLKDGTAMSAEDAIKNLNTSLLNGDGPDVMILDSCPAQSYAQRGMLLDLSGQVTTDDIYKTLLQSFQTSDGLYYVPTQFSLPVLMGNQDSLAGVQTFDDFVNLIANGNDLPAQDNSDSSDPFAGLPEDERPALYFDSLREAYDLLWSAAAPAILKDNALDTEQLRALLAGLQQISDKQRLAAADEANAISIAVGDGTSVEMLPSSLVRYVMQQASYAAYTLNSLSSASITSEYADTATSLFPGLSAGAWAPRSMAGVNADSKAPELATAFVQTMLSPEVQGANYGTGLPVTAGGMQAQMDSINKMREQESQPPLDMGLDSLIGSLQTPTISDEILTETVWNSAEALCKGETDLEGAVKTIEQELKNYLAERA